MKKNYDCIVHIGDDRYKWKAKNVTYKELYKHFTSLAKCLYRNRNDNTYFTVDVYNEYGEIVLRVYVRKYSSFIIGERWICRVAASGNFMQTWNESGLTLRDSRETE